MQNVICKDGVNTRQKLRARDDSEADDVERNNYAPAQYSLQVEC